MRNAENKAAVSAGVEMGVWFARSVKHIIEQNQIKNTDKDGVDWVSELVEMANEVLAKGEPALQIMNEDLK